MSPDTEQSQPRLEAPPSGGGAGGFSDLERSSNLAIRLADIGGLSVPETGAEFARLLALDGPSLYLQIATSSPGATLTLVRQDVARATLCVPQGFCCGAGIPIAHPTDHPYVMVLYCRTASDQRFEATCPTTVRRISLVINGRLRVLSPEDLPLTSSPITA